MSTVGRIERYACASCGIRVITVVRDVGTLPLFTRALAQGMCDHPMRAALFDCPQDDRPSREWVAWDKLTADEAAAWRGLRTDLACRSIRGFGNSLSAPVTS